MAKQSGLGDSLLIDGYDLSGDIGSVQRLAAPSGVLDVTAINASGMERIHSHIDGVIEFRQFFNDAANREHAVLKAKGSGANRVCSYLHGASIGNMGAGLVAKQVNYDWERTADGGLAGPTQCLGNGYGLDYCEQLTAGMRTDTGATQGSSLDGAASSALGLAAYLQVTAFSGTDVTIKIQESDDDSSWGDLTGGAFTVVSGVTAQRIVTSLTATIKRYLRITTTTSGGFSSCTFSVIATRFPYAA